MSVCWGWLPVCRPVPVWVGSSSVRVSRYSGVWPVGVVRVDPVPLLVKAALRYEREFVWPIQGAGQLAGVLGVSRGAVYRWVSDGIVASRAVDVAERAGFDPDVLWPDLADVSASVDESRRVQHNRRATARRAALTTLGDFSPRSWTGGGVCDGCEVG